MYTLPQVAGALDDRSVYFQLPSLIVELDQNTLMGIAILICTIHCYIY